MTRLTPTSYAILGLLAIKPWSTYELTKLLGRSVQFVMPRTEANRYLEPKRLVEAGLATAQETVVGRRRRRVYSITEAGREELAAWLERPAAPTLLESEALLKVLFGNLAPTSILLGHLREFQAEAEATEEPWREIAHEYVEGSGLFPERIHINALFWVLLDRWARLRADWARWAALEVASWPDEHGPRDRGEVQAMLQAALELGTEFPSSRDLAAKNATVRRPRAARARR